MSEPTDSVDALLQHFERVHLEHMQGLPILNLRLAVEVVGASDFDEHQICILITPWFMNLVILPGTDDWAEVDQGESFSIELPREALDFTVCHDEEVGTFLTAVLFRTVSDFPDQETAREVALEIMQQLFSSDTGTGRKLINRRALFTGLGAT